MIAWLLACAGGGELGEPPAPEPVAVRAWPRSRRFEEGEPVEVVFEVRTAPGWNAGSWSLPVPEGLDLQGSEDEEVQQGDLLIHRVHARWTGPPGSYVVPPVEVRFRGPGGQERVASTATLFVDLGVEGPEVDLGAPRRWEPSAAPAALWALGGGLLAVAVLAGGVLAWRRRRRDAPPPPPPPPGEAALAEWEEARSRGLDDHALALLLSSIFRRYLDAEAGIPATRSTTREILEDLRARGIDAERLAAATDLLRATDLVKFARRGGGEALFDRLDRQLRAWVARPLTAGQEEEPGA